MMTSEFGQDVVDSLGKKDLNEDGNIINLAIVGSSRFYDFQIFEELVENWVDDNGYPCLLYTSPSPRDVEESRMPSSA